MAEKHRLYGGVFVVQKSAPFEALLAKRKAIMIKIGWLYYSTKKQTGCMPGLLL